ncbi:MAG: hypothetical protein O3C57_01970, partial [Verrucomicrobia bacterium]|nr:hypothetical protein [Verrucomicrobiota bacterium]
MMRKSSKLLCATVLSSLVLAFAALGAENDMRAEIDTGANTFRRLPADVVDLLRTLPVQDGGRVKPLDTVARFKLLRIHGKRSMRLGDGRKAEKVSATEWMIQSLLYPERVVDVPLFVVDNADVVVAIGAQAHEKKRSRFSYTEIHAARQKLFELSQEYGVIEAQTRTAYQNGIVNLAQNVSEFEYLMHTLDFAREHFSISAEALPGVVEVDTEMRVPDFLRALPRVRASLFAQSTQGGGHEDNQAIQAITEIVTRLSYFVGAGSSLHTIPPQDSQNLEWLSPGQLIDQSMRVAEMPPRAFAHLTALSALVEAGDDAAALRTAAQELCRAVRLEAQARGELKHLNLEVHLYKGNYFFWSLFWFLMAFIVVACSWLKTPNPEASSAARLTGLWVKLAPLTIAMVYLIMGIVLRCVIRGRPPVTNLYETVLFITAVAVLVAMIIEWLVRDHIAIALAPVLGALGMFLANKYEIKEAV